MKPRLAAALLILLPAVLFGQTPEFGNLDVIQNDAGNSATSVTLGKGLGSSPGFGIGGTNSRGDFYVSFGTADDVAAGVMISCVSQNGRDNSAQGDSFGLFYATSAADHVGSGGAAGTQYWVPVFRAAQGDEANINVACGWFPYSGWLGGFARNSSGSNSGATNTLTASAGINLGTQFTTAGGGVFGLDLTSLGGSSAAGVLLVTHGKNEDNYALSKANTDGTFSLYVHDNGANGASYEQDPIAFVYIPVVDVGTKQLVALGRVNSDASTDVSGGSFTVTKGGTGQWYLTVAGEDNTSGVLLVSPEGAGTNTGDNIVSYEWDGANSRWVIESRDLSGSTALPTLQDGSTAAEDMFSFAFFATPNNAPEVVITEPVASEFTTPGTFDVVASATDIDGTIQQVEFLRNGVVVGTDTTAPYALSETSLPAGKYLYVARATDDFGGVSSSPAKAVDVKLDPLNLPANAALWFDGANDHVTMGTALDLGVGGPPSNGFTVECWFRKEGAGITASSGSGGVSVLPLVAKGRGEADGSNLDCNYIFGIDANGLLAADFEDFATGLNHPVVASNAPIQDGVWHHAAVTYDGDNGTWTIYFDGAPVGSGSAPAATLPRYDSIQHFGIGSAMTSTGATQGFFAGVIDEVRIWNYARSVAEIGNARDSEIATEAGLIGRYGLNEGDGLATASTTGSSGGTLVNGPLWVEGAPFATTPNLAPVVSVTSPSNGSSVFAGSMVALTADATDSDGTITKVEFRVNGMVIGEDTSAPYTIDWTPAEVGSYSVSATATDNLGAVGFSAANAVSVVFDPSNLPANTALRFDGVNDFVTMGAAPELNVGGPPSNGFTLECWFRQDGPGITATSGSGGVLVAPLFCKGRGEADGSNVDCNHFFGITSAGLLAADFETFSSGQNYPITATNTPITYGAWHHAAVTYDGNSGNWSMYLDGLLVGTATAPAGQVPRYDSIQHFAIGSALNSTGSREGAFDGVIDEVRVWDHARSRTEIAQFMNLEIPSAPGLIGRFGLNEGTGSTATSSIASATVGTLTNGPVWSNGAPFGSIPVIDTAIAKGAAWKYLDNGSDQGTAWKEPAFDDSTWASGAAPLGGGDTHIVTNVNLGPSGGRYITTYFRRTFELTGASLVQALKLAVMRDDGAVVYINGTEVARQNLPAGTIDYQTITPIIVSGADETTYFPETITSLPPLVNGTNVIAVEVHQRDNNSSDLGFDLELVIESSGGSPPTVALTLPAGGATFTAPASILLAADATDADGSVAKVEFFEGANKLGEDASAPFTFDWTGVPQGSYTLTAKATDDTGLSTTSAGVSITVDPPVTMPPVVAITSPANDANFIEPATIVIDATASDTDGSVTKVEFFEGANKLGEDDTAPYSFTWSSVPAGDYTLTARATDDQTATTTSSPIAVHVLPNQPPTIALVSPADEAVDADTAGTVTLEASVSDPEGQAMTVTFYGRESAPEPGPDFTLVTIPDTQFYTENNNNRFPQFLAQTNWIVSSKDTLNTAFVAHMGDMTQNYNNVEAEFQRGDQAMDIIEDPVTTMLTHGIPWGGAPGNHDIGSGGNTSLWNQYFGTARWAGRPYFGGGYAGLNDQNYQFFSASGLDFIVVNLAYNSSSSGNQAVMDWADALLKAYPNHRAIVTSHWLIGTGNPAAWGGHGQAVYDNLKDNPNLFLMLAGHIHGEGRRSDVFEGRTVHTVLQDYQSRSDGQGGGGGWLRYFVFSPASNTITAKTYRTTTDQFETDADSEFTLSYEMGGPGAWVPLGTVNVPAAGTVATLEWTGLAPDSEFEWYAAVSDGVTTPVATTTRSFSTSGNAAPTVALTSPTEGAVIELPATVNLVANASDSDGTIAKVEFYEGSNKIGEDDTAPYEFAWTAISGSYALMARAIDNQDEVTDSTVVNVTVTNPSNQLPTVAVIQPTGGSSVSAGTVTLAADATDTDGLIVNVEFYEGAVKLGEDASAPFGIEWAGVTPGDHTITAVATDNDGGMQTSAPVTFTALPITDLVFQDGLNGYTGTRDTYIRSDSAAQDTSYGSDADISIDGDDGSPGSAPNHGLIRFDDIFGSGLYQIPAGSTITSATLTLTIFDPGSGMTVHRMLADWLESSTWNSLVGGVQTDDVEAVASALASVGANNSTANVAVGELNLDVTAAVQAWASGAANYGFAFIPFAAGTNGIDVRSREHGTASERPKLAVTFTPPSLPEVTIAATDAAAGEHGADQAIEFTISRTGGTSNALTIQLSAGGTATAGLDYSGFQASFEIPATQASAALPLSVIADNLSEGGETVSLTITADAAYEIGSPGSADATIADRPDQNWYFDNIPDPAMRGPAQNADSDIHPNIVEYFMGTLPGDGSSVALTPVTTPGDGSSAVFCFQRALNRDDVSGVVEWSTNLSTWHRSGESDGTLTVNIAESTDSQPTDDPQIIKATATNPGGVLPEQFFFRLSVTQE